MVDGMDQLGKRVEALGAEIGIVTVPGDVERRWSLRALQLVVFRGILNFAPVVLRLPPHVSLVTVDLAIQLEQLAFLVQHGDGVSRPPEDEEPFS